MALTAGLKMMVIRRTAPDWSKWSTSLSLHQVGWVYDAVALNHDGSLLAVECQDGVCVYRLDPTTHLYQPIWNVTAFDKLAVGLLALDSQPGALPWAVTRTKLSIYCAANLTARSDGCPGFCFFTGTLLVGTVSRCRGGSGHHLQRRRAG
jgi:hypothetical protein